MDIKQRLQQVIDIQSSFSTPDVTTITLCRDAIGEIERLEKITGVGVSLEMYETLRRERDAARKSCGELLRQRREQSAIDAASRPDSRILRDDLSRLEILLGVVANAVLGRHEAIERARPTLEKIGALDFAAALREAPQS